MKKDFLICYVYWNPETGAQEHSDIILYNFVVAIFPETVARIRSVVATERNVDGVRITNIIQLGHK